MKARTVAVNVVGILLLMLVFPAITRAALVPGCEGATCGFADFIQLLKNVMGFLLTIAVPLFAVLFSWAGFLMVTGAGKPAQITRAKGVMTTAFIGFGLALGAYLIVNLLTTFFLNKNASEIFSRAITPTYEID